MTRQIRFIIAQYELETSSGMTYNFKALAREFEIFLYGRYGSDIKFTETRVGEPGEPTLVSIDGDSREGESAYAEYLGVFGNDEELFLSMEDDQ